MAPSPAKFKSEKVKKWPKMLYRAPWARVSRAKKAPRTPMATRRPSRGRRDTRPVRARLQHRVKTQGCQARNLVSPTKR